MRLERVDDSFENTDEERWQTLGKVGKVLFVVYTERGIRKRIISAGIATKAEKGVALGMTTVTIKAGQKPTEEQLRRIDAAAKMPFVYDPDCPPSSEKALKEFAAMARELRRAKKEKKRTRKAVTIRLDPDSLEIFKSLGQGYTTVMADVLTYAAKNPDILSRMRT